MTNRSSGSRVITSRCARRVCALSCASPRSSVSIDRSSYTTRAKSHPCDGGCPLWYIVADLAMSRQHVRSIGSGWYTRLPERLACPVCHIVNSRKVRMTAQHSADLGADARPPLEAPQRPATEEIVG